MGSAAMRHKYNELSANGSEQLATILNGHATDATRAAK
jgi:hypothetical protein